MQLSGNYVVLDLETTGLDYKLERILEIGAVKLIDGHLEEPFHTLIDPLMPIPNTAIHGIDDEMVKGAPTIEQVLPGFVEFLGDWPLVAHNAIFDYNFINHNAQGLLKLRLTNPLVDTLQIAREVFPQEKSHSLGSLLTLLDRPAHGLHRALNDTMALAGIFPTLMDMLAQKRAWQRAQFSRIDFLAQRFADIEKLMRSLHHEHSELRRVLQLYFEEGGENLTTLDGQTIFLDKRDSWEYCMEELKPLLEEWGLYDRIARPERGRLERWLKGDRLTPEQKEEILATRRFLGISSKVSLCQNKDNKDSEPFS